MRWIVSYAFCSYACISLLGAIWGTYYLQTLGFARSEAAIMNSMIWIGLAVQFSAHGALHHHALIYTRHDFTFGLCIMPVIFFVGALIALFKIKEGQK